VLQFAQGAGLAVVPVGGNTGLAGGTHAQGAVMLSLERLNRIRAVTPAARTVTAEAGTILSRLHDAAAAEGLHFPLWFGARGSATLGCALSTNAGGSNVLRYGSTRGLCLGLEVVLADGRVLDLLQGVHKDNTGYDLKDLFIGAEGTLGIITAASLRLVAPPPVTGAALMVVPGPAQALDLLALAEGLAPGCVSAFELMHGQGLAFLAQTMPEVRQPFGQPPEWFVLVDLGLPHGLSAQTALETLFEAGVGAGLVSDGIIAQSEGQRAAFWSVRENIPEANRRIGAVSSHDISLPLSEVAGFVVEAGPALDAIGAFRINCFGHLGDGNLHYNVFPAPGRSRKDHEAQRDAIKGLVHDMVHARGGSVSAEHGLGRLKTGDLARYGDPAKVAAMGAAGA